MPMTKRRHLLTLYVAQCIHIEILSLSAVRFFFISRVF